MAGPRNRFRQNARALFLGTDASFLLRNWVIEEKGEDVGRGRSRNTAGWLEPGNSARRPRAPRVAPAELRRAPRLDPVRSRQWQTRCRQSARGLPAPWHSPPARAAPPAGK